MPNHITNYLRITSKSKAGAKQLQELYNKIYSVKEEDKSKVPTIDFNSTVPMPEKLNNTISPPQSPKEKRQQKRYVAKYGSGNWYDWACRNWGTKWNAYNATEPEVLQNGYVFCFQTAWSPPAQWIATTAGQFPALRFEDKWHDEGGSAGCLTITMKKGELQVDDKETSEHEWYYEFDEGYQDRYRFITEGDYAEVIKECKDKGEEDYGTLLPFLLKRIKDEDLPLFMNFQWWGYETEFEKRLKGMKGN